MPSPAVDLRLNRGPPSPLFDMQGPFPVKSIEKLSSLLLPHIVNLRLTSCTNTDPQTW